MSKLVREAIADAKALKESAIENAKLALQEKFMPKLELAIDDEIYAEADAKENDRLNNDTATPSGDVGKTTKDTDNAKKEAKGVKEQDEDEVDDEDEDEVEETKKENRELQEILAELDLTETDDKDEDDYEEEDVDESIEISESELNELLEELELESILAEGDDKDEDDEDEVEEGKKLPPWLDKDYKKGKDDDDDKKDERIEQLESDLAEAYDAIKLMRDKINEVNLMNSKLLFTNKIFNKYGDLTENQKMKILETFDRAQTQREVKLVYSTIALQLEDTIPATSTNVIESFGSDTLAGPGKNAILEEDETIKRFRLLANIPQRQILKD